MAACQKDTSATEVAAASASGPAAVPQAQKAPPLADADVARAVERHMQEDAALRTEHVKVTVEQGVASLSGTVGDLLAKERAVRVAESIKGVRSVVDQVTVTPERRTDEQLEADVLSALQQDPATRPHSLGVTASEGKVTLTGTADSYQQKSLFADVVKTVKGVKSLENDVQLHYAASRPVSEIAADVKNRLANDVWVDGDVINVDVTGRTVRLSGVVGSAAQRTRVRSDGWVAGVEAVDDAGITVDWWTRNDQKHVSDFISRSDAEIAAAVRDAFRYDPRLTALLPKVAVKYGVVTLSGDLDSASARRAAAADAKDTVGVWSVRNEILVAPGGTPTDTAIEHAAKRLLADDVFLAGTKPLQVATTKGKIALRGTISSPYERFAALDDMMDIPGVVEIDDQLVLLRPPAELKAAIEDRLFWDPMVERDRVSVAVGPEGVATLTGTLDSWIELRASADDALLAGASRVVNLLELKGHPEVTAP